MTSSYPQNFGSGSTPKKSFGAGGCQALSDGRKCGETKNLQIIHEFKRLYENKMKQIDDAAGGDCVQAKISLQQEWIRDLTDQNEMLVKVVEELEVEAAERVTMLEDKLQHTAKCACESEKLAKDKDKKVKELEEQLKKLKEVAEKNEEAQKSCQKYAELKKKMEEEKNDLLEKIKRLEEENQFMKEAIMKAKKNLDKLENKAEAYLEERDELKRKHRESMEVIETLQQENRRSKNCLETLEEEQKSKKGKVVQELEDYEKKHRECMKKLESLREELEKTKKENNNSMLNVQSLRDENKSQAETISELKEKLRNLTGKSRTSVGVTCKSPCTDTGVDSRQMEMKNVGIEHSPETANTSTICKLGVGCIEPPRTIPTSTRCAAILTTRRPTKLRTVGCQSCLPLPASINNNRQSPPSTRRTRFDSMLTVRNYDSIEQETILHAQKPPILKKKDAVEILEILEPSTLDAYGASSCESCNPFAFANSGYTATGDERQIEEMLQVELLANVNECLDCKYSGAPRLKSLIKPKSRKAELIYNCNNMCPSSNDSFTSDTDNQDLNTAFLHDPTSKKVAIDDDIARTYYSTKDNDSMDVTVDEPEFVGTQVLPVERKKRVKDVNTGTASKPTKDSGTSKDVNLEQYMEHNIEKSSRSHSPARAKTQGTSPTEDLHHVVQDLNESVSRIIEKTPNEKANRQKIAQLEAQLRAALKEKERDVELERQKRKQEVENLKMTINEMDKALQNKQQNSANLQSAVELYMNSISVLEESEERYKNEITQQRVTIANLQEALVITKQQLDDLKHKCQKDVSSKWTSWFGSSK